MDIMDQLDDVDPAWKRYGLVRFLLRGLRFTGFIRSMPSIRSIQSILPFFSRAAMRTR